MSGVLETENERLRKALQFCADISEEELAYAKVGTGAEVALRHISRKARTALGLESVVEIYRDNLETLLYGDEKQEA